MRTTTALLVVVCLLGSLGVAGAAPSWSWGGPWPDSCLLEWTPDPAAVPGVRTTWSLETWNWTPNPLRSPDVYWLQVILNGRPSDLSQDMLRVGAGYYLIPLRALPRLGLTGTLSPDDMVTIVISGKGHTVRTRLGSYTATVDGFNQRIPVPARWQRGLVYVPLGMLNRAFNLNVRHPEGGPLYIGSAPTPDSGPATPS